MKNTDFIKQFSAPMRICAALLLCLSFVLLSPVGTKADDSSQTWEAYQVEYSEDMLGMAVSACQGDIVLDGGISSVAIAKDGTTAVLGETSSVGERIILVFDADGSFSYGCRIKIYNVRGGDRVLFMSTHDLYYYATIIPRSRGAGLGRYLFALADHGAAVEKAYLFPDTESLRSIGVDTTFDSIYESIAPYSPVSIEELSKGKIVVYNAMSKKRIELINCEEAYQSRKRRVTLFTVLAFCFVYTLVGGLFIRKRRATLHRCGRDED